MSLGNVLEVFTLETDLVEESVASAPERTKSDAADSGVIMANALKRHMKRRGTVRSNYPG